MSEINAVPFCLNADYSTTRRVCNLAPEVENPPDAKFQRVLFLPPHGLRKGEGGLRTKGYFKVSSCQCRDTGKNVSEDAPPLITVITSVLNAAKTLEQSILSVIKQSYDNIEYIIIDGGSTDGTIDIIRRYEQAIDYWVSEPDKGIYDALNKAIRLASGDWLAFLGSDDTYLAGAIDSYVEMLADCPDKSLEYISSRVNLTTGKKVIRTVGKPWSWKSLLKHMLVAHVNSLHSRALFQRYGLYDISYKICGDYEFLLRAGTGLRAAFLDSVTVNMEIGGTSDNSLLTFREVERAKVTSVGQSALVSRIEMIIAIAKWKLRKLLWY